jgi:hypothetical protein
MTDQFVEVVDYPLPVLRLLVPEVMSQGVV